MVALWNCFTECAVACRNFYHDLETLCGVLNKRNRKMSPAPKKSEV